MKLYLDDERKTPVGFERVNNYKEFVEFIKKNGLPDFISFDHDLGYNYLYKDMIEDYDPDIDEKNGYDCAKWLVNYCLENNLDMCEYEIHSMNPAGKNNIDSILQNYINYRNNK